MEILDLTVMCSESSDSDGEGARKIAQKGLKNKRETRTVSVKDLPKAAHDQIDRKAGIRVTCKEKVERIVEISNIPTGWDVSKKLTGYLLTLDDDASFLKMDEKSISSWIRHEVGFSSQFFILFALILALGSVLFVRIHRKGCWRGFCVRSIWSICSMVSSNSPHLQWDQVL